MERVSPEAAKYLEGLFGRVPKVPPVQEFLDAKLEEADEGRAVFSMKAHPGLHNVIQVVHGGVLTSLAELAASVALVTSIGENEAITFIAQTTNYERPVREGIVRAEARVVRKGSRISLVEVVLTGPDEREVARASLTALSQVAEGNAS